MSHSADKSQACHMPYSDGFLLPDPSIQIKHELHKSWSDLAHRERVLLPKMDGTLHLHNNATWQCRVTSERRPSTCLNLDQGRVEFSLGFGQPGPVSYMLHHFQWQNQDIPKPSPAPALEAKDLKLDLSHFVLLGWREWRTVGTSPEI